MGKIDQRIKLSLLFLLACLATQAQYNIGFEPSTALPFSESGNLRLATAGGFSNPQFSPIHFNDDGEEDLFVFDRNNDIWRTYLYNSTTSEYDYHPELESNFPSTLNELVLLRDYNCDGFMDIFTYNNGKFAVYKNDGAFPPSFQLVTNAIQSDYGSLVTSAFILPGDIPAIVDVDNDGDIDILTFGNGDSENSVVWHENLSMDQFGNCDSLEFKVNTECWGGFQEPPNASNLEAISCRPEVSPPTPFDLAARHHPGSTLLLTDTDNDGDMDIAIGDIQTKTFVYAPNVGDASSPDIDVSAQSTNFPSATNPANMQYMIAGYELDANHDGKNDLLVTTNNNIDSSCNDGHTWLYLNTASSGAVYELATKSFLLEEMVDLGSGAVPVVMDVSGDGLDDLIIASDFYRSPTSNRRSRLNYFENVGTATSPSFSLTDGDFANTSNFAFQAAHPALGDLDNDGDLDMLIGDADGFLHYFRNNPIGGVASFTLVAPNYMGINSIDQNAAPEIADINGDGLLDLLVGERVGTIAYFENTGTLSSAQFASAPTIAEFGKIDVSFFCCNGFAAPRYVNNPAFGDKPYLFVGTSEKRINVYEIRTNLSDSFKMADSIFILSDRITPAISDFDSDEIFDLLVGTGEGGLKYMQRDGNYPAGVPSLRRTAYTQGISVFPNPTSDVLTIQVPESAMATITVLDALGQVSLQKALNNTESYMLDVAGLQSGVYFLHWTTQQHSAVTSFIVQ